jgi:hypothetical protein
MDVVYIIASDEDAALKLAEMTLKGQLPRIYKTARQCLDAYTDMGFMGSRYRAWEVVNGVAMRMSPSVVSIEQFGAVSG